MAEYQMSIEDVLTGRVEEWEKKKKTLDEIWAEQKPEQMSSDSWKVYRYFRDNALNGKHVVINAKQLSNILGLTERTLREASEEISRFTDLAFIGDDKGYRIAKDEKEYQEYCNMRLSRTKSSMIKTAHVLGGTAYLHQILNEIEDEVTHKPNSRQQRIKLTKDTNTEVRKFFVDYNSWVK